MKKFLLIFLGISLAIFLGLFLFLSLLREGGTFRTYFYCSDDSTLCFVGVYDGGYSSYVYQGGKFSDYYKSPAFRTVEFTEAAYGWLSDDHLVVFINAAEGRYEAVNMNGRRVVVEIRDIIGDPCKTAFEPPDTDLGSHLRCAKGERVLDFKW